MTVSPLRRSALLVMDYQVGVAVPYGTPAAIEATAQAIGAARRTATPRIWLTGGYRPGHPEVTDTNKVLDYVRANDLFIEGSPGTEIVPELAPRETEVVVRKRRTGAFAGTELEQLLRAWRITDLALAGVTTSGVVLSTLRDAADRDYACVVLADACADHDAELHDVLMSKLFPRQADVVGVREWASSLG